MPYIPSTINGVVIEFATGVNKNVQQVLINGLTHCIKSNVAVGYSLSKIYISSAFDSHKLPSRHMQQKAVDISRINGTKISVGYSGEVKSIGDAIQDTFETFQHKRENFGPHLKKKQGHNYTISGHNDHIHLSVN